MLTMTFLEYGRFDDFQILGFVSESDFNPFNSFVRKLFNLLEFFFSLWVDFLNINNRKFFFFDDFNKTSSILNCYRHGGPSQFI